MDRDQHMSRKGELRRHVRSTNSAPVRIGWQDGQGMDKFINTRTVDISESGMRIEAPVPIENRTYVTLQCSALGLRGTASVRSCTRKGMQYVVGLEFSNGFRLAPKS
jgi:PilZ domain